MKSRLRHIVRGHIVPGDTHESLGWALDVWCPGCDLAGWSGLHRVGVTTPEGPAYGEEWQWDGNVELPTISPSILSTQGEGRTCHAFLRAGRWEFLSDSTHPLAGQTIDVVDLPVWLVGEA